MPGGRQLDPTCTTYNQGLLATLTMQTIVSLAFDNGGISQYTLGYQHALQPHAVKATFYINSGVTGGSTHMSWTQLATLRSAGNEIGGKTVDGINLTTLTTQQQINEICNDRQTLTQHGLNPAAFAYPAGTFNTSIETEVQNCGYDNARTAGSLSPSGPTYGETLPPRNVLALRAYAPAGQVTLANLQSPGDRRGVLRRRLDPDRHPEGVLPDAGPGELQHLHLRVRMDRTYGPQHLLELGPERRQGRRRAGRRRFRPDRGHRQLVGVTRTSRDPVPSGIGGHSPSSPENKAVAP